MNQTLPLLVFKELSGARQRLSKMKVTVGLDGFVDTILHVVDTRESAAKYTRVESMAEFGRRIQAAAGLSANFELVSQMLKLGGNGPIMANALDSFGTEVTYIGNLGSPAIHPVFHAFAARTNVISIAEPGYTDALEFQDGKLMCGKLDGLKDVTWTGLLKHLPEERILSTFSESSLIALVNWTMVPFMSAIFDKLLARVAPKLKGDKRWMFFDLADPAKRTREDLAAVLRQISRFQKYFRVILGLNFRESVQVGEVLGLKEPDETYGTVTEHAALVQKKLGVETVVVHPSSFAAAADAAGSSHVVGAFTATPKITTGAGDHFNAGFCLGRLLGLNLESSLQLGVATSGYYVRTAKSPRLQDLQAFLKTL
jgi:hypothetical protein